MPIIKVVKPFGLRLDSGSERQDFGVGEHFITDEELRHWFILACLVDGRAVLVPEEIPGDALGDSEGGVYDPAEPGAEGEVDNSIKEEDAATGTDADPEGDTDPEEEAAADPEEEAELVSPTREELMNLTVPKLREIAASCGATLPSNANKAAIVDILLAGREGVTLVKSPDGSWVEKAE